MVTLGRCVEWHAPLVPQFRGAAPVQVLPWRAAATSTTSLNGLSFGGGVHLFPLVGILLARRRNRGSRQSARSMGMMGLRGKSDARAVSEYFEGKVVWITGASGGLGEALCIALCRLSRPRGLVLSARTLPELERVRRHCLELQPDLQAEVVPVDLADIDTLHSVADKALQSFGGFIDVLVNNGGRGFRDVAAQTPLEVDRVMMNVNYFSGVALVKSLLPSWIQANSGHIVQISSVQGFFGLPGRTAYSATKHAAVGFYDSLRAEVAESGICVTMVAPGYIATKHSENAAHGGGTRYPEGHTSKGVPPESMAPQILAAVARRQPEFVPAALDARLARLLRCACPPLLFRIMRRRAAKERLHLAAAQPPSKDGEGTKPLKGA